MESRAKQLIQTIFDVNNPYMLACERILNLFVLNLFFVLTCLPILTIGPAKIALYGSLKRLHEGQRAGLISSYLRNFKENLLQGGILGLLELFVVGFCLLDLFLLSSQSGPLVQVFQALFIGMLFLTILIFSYVYPLVSQRKLTSKQALKTSLLLAGLNLPWSLFILGVWLGLGMLLIYNALTLMMGLSGLLLFGFAVLAYVHYLIMDAIFKKYQ